ncbi:MAG: gliding motility lipoprotein GldH [Bacteroidia bacterium]|nr:gliding motility lipoprotein GldH [Bacteroidia bacterium]
MRNLFCVLCLLIGLTSCDPNRVIDENKEIPGYNWFYKDLVGFDVMVEDTGYFYNIYLNTRIRSDYKYNNLFVLLHTQLPDKKDLKQRFEIPLADDLGKWQGSGLGDLYDYQFLVVKNANLAQRGIYRFRIEQNMRDDTLTAVAAAGIRIEKGDPKD